MMQFSKEDYIRYRIEKAKDSLSDAHALYDRNSYSACVYRLYYAVFYSANALLYKYNFETKTHKGVLTTINLEFIKTELLPNQIGKILSTLFDLRQKGDYDDFFEISVEIVVPLLHETAFFLKEIEGFLER